jgi:hypothetical protein
VGRGGSPGGSHRPLAVASCRHRAVYEQKKSSGPAAASAEIRGEQLPGSGATLLCYHLFSRKRGFPEPAAGIKRAEAGHGLSPHGLTLLPGFLGDLPTGFFSLICHSFESPETSPAGAAGSGERELRRDSGTSKTRPPPARIAWLGHYRLRGKRGYRSTKTKTAAPIARPITATSHSGTALARMPPTTKASLRAAVASDCSLWCLVGDGEPAEPF